MARATTTKKGPAAGKAAELLTLPPAAPAPAQAPGGARRLDASPRQLAPYPDLNTRRIFPRERIVEIAGSMRKHGTNLQNLVVHDPKLTVDVDGVTMPMYWIVAGETRWRSGMLIVQGDEELEWEPRPDFMLDCRVGEFARWEALEILLIENEQRGGLTVIEAARAIQKLVEEEKYTQARVAEVVFGSTDKQPHVNQLLGLLDMPEAVQDLLEEQHLGFTHVRDYLRPLWGRLSPDRRDEVFAGLVVRIQSLLGQGGKVSGPWLSGLVSEADAEETRLRGQVSLLDELPEPEQPAAPVPPSVTEAEPDTGAGVASGNAAPPMTEEAEIAGLVHNACTLFATGEWEELRERNPAGVPDSAIATTLRSLLADAGQTARFLDGLGTWTPTVDARALRIAVIPSATKATRHLRDAELMGVVRAVMSLPEPGAVAEAAPAPAPAPAAAAPAATPAPRTPALNPPRAPAPPPPPAAAPSTPPLAILPDLGAGRRAIPDGAGIVGTLLAISGDRPVTLSIIPSAQGIIVTVVPKPALTGEAPFTHVAPADSVDDEFVGRLDAHFTT